MFVLQEKAFDAITSAFLEYMRDIDNVQEDVARIIETYLTQSQKELKLPEITTEPAAYPMLGNGSNNSGPS